LPEKNNDKQGGNGVVSTMTSIGGETAPDVRRVTVRFPQCDPAGIVFYPRYFEMLLRHFPQAPLATTPLAVSTRFLRSNRLGDTIEMEFTAGDDWSCIGRMGGSTCFSITPMQDAGPLTDDAHRPGENAFRTSDEILGDWALDRNGRLHLSRYFEFVNMAIEEWLADTLGLPFHELHVGRAVGIPTVSFDTIVRELPEGGATVSTWIRPIRLGNKSMTFTSWFVADGRCVIENEQVVVFVEMQDEGFESIRIPDDIVEAFSRQIDNKGAS
jgi:4-hydroxybenzoyl-CoA thioesterase